MMAHEIRHPLAVIGNTAYLLRSLGAQVPSAEQYSEVLAAEVGRANKHLTALLEFAEARSPDYQRVDLTQLLREVFDQLPPESVSVGVDSERAAILEADPQQLQSVFMKVLRNAYDAMPSGGRILVKVLPGPLSDIEVQHAGLQMCPSESGATLNEIRGRRLVQRPRSFTSSLGAGH